VIRPAIEVADILRALRNRFLKRFKSSRSYQQLKVFRAIERCRTAALGGHRDKCVGCEYEAPFSYNSCRSRCCPKCQARARQRWIEARQRELLPTNYFHVVFTVPHELNAFARTSPVAYYNLLFAASSEALLEVAADPKRLGAEIGFFSILHSWGSNLLLHPHIHCVVPAGGLSPDHQRWIHTSHPLFLVPAPSLRIAFRTRFLDGLAHLYNKGLLDCRGSASAFKDPDVFAATMEQLKKQRWVVDIRPPFGGPEHVLRYLGRYTHRIAISNHRLVSFDGKHVRFRWKDYAHGGKQGVMKLKATEFLRRFFLHVLPKGFVRIRHYGLLSNRFRWKDYAHGGKQGVMKLKATEFLRRFFLHVLPKGFVRIRHYGLLSNRFRKQCLPLAHKLLAADGRYPLPRLAPKAPTEHTPLWHCPKCGRPMRVAQRFTAAELSVSKDLDSS